MLSLGWVGVKRAMLINALARYRNATLLIAASLLTTGLTWNVMAPASAPNLANRGNAQRIESLTDSWARGDVIALVRHVERCDRSPTPCVGPLEGVTVQGEAVAQTLGAHFNLLGLNSTDIYSSELTRARQTADFMFARPVAAQSWLFDCRGTMLRDALKNKVPGRNLVLVTHSECMDELESEMHVPTDTSFAYGTSLFIKAEGLNNRPQMLGYIEPKDWANIVPVMTASERNRLEAMRF